MQTPLQPLVSVITICFNHARFVIESLDSIRAQTYENIQLIIIDDCSKDNSVALISEWIAAHQIKCTFIAHSKNVGICKTLNEALSHAVGEYVSFLASDDTWQAEKTARQVSLMQTLPDEVGVIYSDAYQMDENGALLTQSFLEHHKIPVEKPQGFIFQRLADGNFIPVMSTLVRRNCFSVIGCFDESLCYEDWDMWLRISLRYKFIYSPFKSAQYRIVSTSMARTILATVNVPRLISDFIIRSKCLATNQLSLKQRKNFHRNLSHTAAMLYRHNYSDSQTYLAQAFKAGKHPGILLLWLLSRTPVPFALDRKLLTLCHKIIDYSYWKISNYRSQQLPPH